MLGEIHVETEYLEHGGGTKFYEVIKFYNVDTAKCVLVKRWGKISAPTGGGECKVETYPTQRKLDDAAHKITTSKKGRDYVTTTSNHGFHGLSVSYNRAEDFHAALKKHYTTHAPISEILIGMGIEELQPADDADDNEIIEFKPEPEPERDEDYGSW